MGGDKSRCIQVVTHIDIIGDPTMKQIEYFLGVDALCAVYCITMDKWQDMSSYIVQIGGIHLEDDGTEIGGQ